MYTVQLFMLQYSIMDLDPYSILSVFKGLVDPDA